MNCSAQLQKSSHSPDLPAYCYPGHSEPRPLKRLEVRLCALNSTQSVWITKDIQDSLLILALVGARQTCTSTRRLSWLWLRYIPFKSSNGAGSILVLKKSSGSTTGALGILLSLGELAAKVTRNVEMRSVSRLSYLKRIYMYNECDNPGVPSLSV